MYFSSDNENDYDSLDTLMMAIPSQDTVIEENVGEKRKSPVPGGSSKRRNIDAV